MMKLDKRGDVSIAEIVIYIPILIVSFILVLRHGFTRRAGWIFLLILSISKLFESIAVILVSPQTTRNYSSHCGRGDTCIVGAETNEYHIDHHIQHHGGGWCITSAPRDTRLPADSVSSSYQAVLVVISSGVNRGQNSLDNHPLMSGGTRLMGLVGVVALALTIAGGVTAGNATTESSLNSGTKLRHIGVILFAIVYGFILVVHIFCWSNKNQILRYRRTVSVLDSQPVLIVSTV